ncbi:hypothetical protein AVEN_154833-1 [Araneus ventricosus]|uniref:Mos1 transposase HTH domain-containing protein n=1 Tax=Araneus ventricosus TaxID=182803 RepID=A0A4Y2BWF1_ARAVE|nr:hypothetical protein AVEN_154833-1 [Araneus ventricosus]
MCESLGINTVSYDRVKVWFRKFKAGNFDIEVEPRSFCPIEVDCEQLKQIIDQDRNVSTRTIALGLELHLDGTIFNSNEEVINEVDLLLDSRTPQLFAEGIEKLPKLWQTIVDLNGDYYPH